MIKAILNGSMHHNMRDGCTTRQDGVFPEEALLEIMDGLTTLFERFCSEICVHVN